ncbi:MAG: hypothetical protein LBC60_11135 [Spirochaetaceae bacterium]|jgi:protein phosphatase|nr:hypothetical protein [Spirochaetaceae bacterium]
MLFSKGGCTQGFNTFLTALKGGVSNPFGTNQPSQQKEVSLFQGSLTYRDQRFRGYDAAALVEVIEHLDEDRLETLAAVVFGDARPGVVVISTPNREYNTVYGRRDFRHRDHRFEWTREEFRFWAERVAGQYGYNVSFEDIGPVDELQGPPTQMGVFVRGELSDGGGGPGPLPPGAGEEPADSFLPGVETLPAIEDVLKPHTVQTRLGQGGDLVPAPGEENSAAALEIMSRFSADPRWLIYLPPAMSPCKTSSLPEFLEHPREAFDYYRKAGLARIICEEKHPGSRAVIVLCRSRKTALDRFGVKDDSPGIIYTRKGRRFFDSANAVVEQAILERLGKALDRSGFWEACATDWVCLDTVVSPWPAKDRRRLKEQYAPVGRSGRNGLAAGAAALREALSARGPAAEPIPDGSSSPAADMPSRGLEKQRAGPPADLNIAGVLERFEQRKKCLDQYTEVCRRYRRRMASPSSSSTASMEDYRVAPFHLLATEGKVWNNETHLRHLETIRRFMTGTDPLFIIPNYLTVDLNDENALSAATDWWLGLTDSGGEGMVVKPWDFIARRGAEPLQPAVKCRGREYLRIIYGPEYTLPDTLDRLRSRSLAKKRRLALAEFALGMESLERFVRKEPFHRLHECVFALLALKCEPMDPRL